MSFRRIVAGPLALVSAAAGGACAASAQTDPTAVIEWDDVIEVATGEAYQGPWRMNESDFRFVDDPTVAVTTDGAIGVAWVDQSRKDVFFQLYEPDGAGRLPEPVNVSRSPRTFSWLPRLVLAPGDPARVFVLWQEIVFSGGTHGGEIFFARSTDGGRSFGEPINLSNTSAGAGKGRLTARRWDNGSLDLVQAPGGVLYAAWTEYEGALRFSRSVDDGRSFSAPVLVAGGRRQLPARGPSLAAADDDVLYLAWTVGEDAAADLRLARSDDGGRSFGEARVVLPGRGHADAPAAAVDANGTLHLVYGERRPGLGGGHRVRYSRSVDGGRSFEEPRDLSGSGTDAGYPALALDGHGNPYVVWELFPPRSGRPRGLGLGHSRDGGGTFTAPGVVPGAGDPAGGFNGSGQGLLMRKLAVSETGELAVVNSTFRPNESSRIRLYRGRVATPPDAR